MSASTDYIGHRIRKLRLKKGVTLNTLSSATRLTASLLSQVERGLANPSVSSLHKIADALQVSIGSFFEKTDGLSIDVVDKPGLTNISPIVHESSRKVLSPCTGITYYLLTKDLQGQIEFILAVFEVGADTGTLTHFGEECCLMLEGKAEIHINTESYIVERGDSLQYKSSLPHRVVNIGDQTMKAIWAITPPSF
jgi:transcriptional regulator with XRE-family HTH domain